MKIKLPAATPVLAAAWLLLAGGALAAEPTSPSASLHGSAAGIDLIASYQQALRFDPRMRAADEALAAGREKAEQGRALLRPQVGLSASLTRLDERSSSSLPAALAALAPNERSGQSHQVALQMTQPLYNAKSRAEREQLIQQSGLAEVQHRQAAQDLIRRVGETYLAVLLAEETLRVVQAEKAAVQMQRDRAQARFDVGRGRITEVQEAQARYDGVLTREVSAQSTLVQRRAQYAELTGLPGQGLRPLAPSFEPAAPAPDSLEAWQDKGLAANSRVQLKQVELAIAEAETSKWKLQSRPTLGSGHLPRGEDRRGPHQCPGAAGALGRDGAASDDAGPRRRHPHRARRARCAAAPVRRATRPGAGAHRLPAGPPSPGGRRGRTRAGRPAGAERVPRPLSPRRAARRTGRPGQAAHPRAAGAAKRPDPFFFRLHLDRGCSLVAARAPKKETAGALAPAVRRWVSKTYFMTTTLLLCSARWPARWISSSCSAVAAGTSPSP